MLSDKQWAKLEPLPPQHSSAGRPWKDNRAVLKGILRALKTGARWRDFDWEKMEIEITEETGKTGQRIIPMSNKTPMPETLGNFLKRMVRAAGFEPATPSV